MTHIKSLITPTALLAAFAFSAIPTVAQERAHGRQGQQAGGERAQPRAQAPQAQAPAPRPQAQAPAARPQAQAARPQPSAAPRVQTRQDAPRPQQARPVEAPRAQAPRAVPGPRGDNRRYEDHRNDVGRAVPRGNVYAPRYDPRYSPRYAPRVYAPRVYGPRSYYRPYVFRPRVSIGFGIYAGYPVPYSYSYPYPIPVYGYGAPQAEVLITPGATAYGGVALEITPYDADVYVDGQYAGKVQDFDGTTQPLTLAAGTHRIEVQAPGYQPMTVDVGIQAGQVVPYRGDLQPY